MAFNLMEEKGTPLERQQFNLRDLEEVHKGRVRGWLSRAALAGAQRFGGGRRQAPTH